MPLGRLSLSLRLVLLVTTDSCHSTKSWQRVFLKPAAGLMWAFVITASGAIVQSANDSGGVLCIRLGAGSQTGAKSLHP